jgi:uncharacterized membrane protein YsdA (DUF1294 family)
MLINTYWYSLLTIFLLINITGFITVAMDKHKARKRHWRIPERTFFLISLVGGAPGVYLGLLLFRHKTRHWYFMLGIPFIFVLQLFLIYFLLQ